MPLEPSPYVKKAMDALGCAEGAAAPTEEAERVLRGFLAEAERVVESRLNDGSGVTPIGILNESIRALPGIVAAQQMAAMMSITTGKPSEPLESSMLGKIVALIATSATTFLKDLAFVGNNGLEGRCEHCKVREGCPKYKSEHGDG